MDQAPHHRPHLRLTERTVTTTVRDGDGTTVTTDHYEVGGATDAQLDALIQGMDIVIKQLRQNAPTV